jgi:hypothetical protein
MNTDSNMGALIKLGGNLENPRDSKATDWPNVGASGPAGQESGANQLIKLTEAQEGPRHSQDSGENTPSVWGKVEGYTVSVSKGESGSAPSAVSIKGSVDCKTGQMSPNAEDQTY